MKVHRQASKRSLSEAESIETWQQVFAKSICQLRIHLKATFSSWDDHSENEIRFSSPSASVTIGLKRKLLHLFLIENVLPIPAEAAFSSFTWQNRTKQLFGQNATKVRCKERWFPLEIRLKLGFSPVMQTENSCSRLQGFLINLKAWQIEGCGKANFRGSWISALDIRGCFHRHGFCAWIYGHEANPIPVAVIFGAVTTSQAYSSMTLIFPRMAWEILTPKSGFNFVYSYTGYSAWIRNVLHWESARQRNFADATTGRQAPRASERHGGSEETRQQ